MNEIENPFIQHLTEIKAREKSSDIREMMEYIIAETKIREILWTMRDQEIQFKQEFSFLKTDIRQIKAPIYDFLVSKDIFDLIVFLNDEKGNGHFHISKQRFEMYLKAFKEYPYVEGLADVWISKKDYPTKCLFLRDVKSESTKAPVDVSDEIYPFRDAIIAFFDKSIKKVPSIEFKQKKGIYLGTVGAEEQTQKVFENYKSKKPRLNYKTKALEKLTEDDLKNLIDIFQMKIDNKEILKEKIEKIARRGI